MQIPSPSSSQWADKIAWMLGGSGLLGGIIGLVKLIFYRNKPKSEIAKLDAETEGAHASTAVKLSSQLVTLNDRMNLMEASIDAHQQETAITIKYYRGQLEYFEALDLAYRNRSHALNGELGRLVLAVANLQTDFAEKTGEKPQPVAIRTYDEIIRPFPLPESPK